MTQEFISAVVTGANGSVGRGICARLIETFSNQIIIHALVRNQRKGEELKEYLKDFGKDLKVFVHLVDLLDFESIHHFVSDLTKQANKLNLLFLNAGVMPTDGLDLRTGFVNLFTRPTYLAKTGGDVLKQKVGLKTDTGLGWVFACNVFGHYYLLTNLIPLLSKGAELDQKAIVQWCSSTTAVPEFFDPDDWQCITGRNPYESSKRLCEIVSITLYEKLANMGIYSFVTSPGNVISNISTSQASEAVVLFSLYMMRLFGCSGINITGYNAATSAIWLASHNSPSSLDPRTLYHSEISLFGNKTWVKDIEILFTKKDLEIGKNMVRQMDLLKTALER